MANIDFSLLTVPLPQPYDEKDDRRQQENFYYILNQLFALAKNAGFSFSDQVTNPTTSANMAGVEQAIKDLQWEGVLLDLGGIKVIRTRKTGGVVSP